RSSVILIVPDKAATGITGVIMTLSLHQQNTNGQRCDKGACFRLLQVMAIKSNKEQITARD
ncbi:MAG TPA: hypothetical protein VKY62_09095, partial [Devosia sp.]|nr:hypothetical protein [Devosia sp.]